MFIDVVHISYFNCFLILIIGPIIQFCFCVLFINFKEARYTQAVCSLEFDKQLGPYTLSQYGEWKRLSSYITKSIIERIGMFYFSYAQPSWHYQMPFHILKAFAAWFMFNDLMPLTLYAFSVIAIFFSVFCLLALVSHLNIRCLICFNSSIQLICLSFVIRIFICIYVVVFVLSLGSGHDWWYYRNCSTEWLKKCE